MKVVITDHNYMDFTEERKMFEEAGATLEISQCTTEEEVIQASQGAIALINSDIPITRKIIESLPDLKVIARYGIGVDHIDVEAATEHQVYVTNVPDYCQDEVASHALALIMSLTRKIVLLNQQVKDGSWAFDAAAPLHRFSSQTVGLVSYGKIARTLSSHLQAIGFNVIAYDPYVEQANIDVDVELVSLEELMKRSDVISLHCPLVKETYQMINKEMFDLAKPNAVLVNTGRGAVIHENDLVDALVAGKIAGAGLDVVEEEPIDENHPLLTMDQVILTPHVAFYSEESMEELKQKTASNIVSVLQGEKPKYVVND